MMEKPSVSAHVRWRNVSIPRRSKVLWPRNEFASTKIGRKFRHSFAALFFQVWRATEPMWRACDPQSQKRCFVKSWHTINWYNNSSIYNHIWLFSCHSLLCFSWNNFDRILIFHGHSELWHSSFTGTWKELGGMPIPIAWRCRVCFFFVLIFFLLG